MLERLNLETLVLILTSKSFKWQHQVTGNGVPAV